MAYTTLISTSELRENLQSARLVVVDCRFQLKDPVYGRRAYQESHISGAVYAHLDEDLSGPVLAGKTGRHPLPSVQSAAQKFSAWGIEDHTQVVAYDAQGGALAASRLWWLLRWLGHDEVAVLDGGWQKWQREGLPIRAGTEHRRAGNFVPRPRPALVIDSDTVLRSIGDPGFRLLDARTADRYRGENETIDPVAGRIPGAISAPYPDNLGPDGTFKTAGELRSKYEALLNGVPPDRAAIYCGSGGTAPQDILAMRHAGLGEAKLYAGSWSEWITDRRRPIRRGEEHA